MDHNQPLKKRIVEQPILHALQTGLTYVQQPHPQQYYQYISMAENQQQSTNQLQQNNHQHQQQQQQYHYPHQYQRLQQQPHQQQLPTQLSQKVIHYEYVERPMTLNAWTQTKSDDYPNLPPPSHQWNEAALLAKIRDLEECLKVRTEFINHIKEKKLRTPSPPHTVPNSTTITPTTIKHEGTRYRILAQADEATNEAQIEIELSEEGISHNLNCSTDSERLEICLSDENESSPRTPTKSIVAKNILSKPERPDLENATVSIGPNGTKIPVCEYEKMSWTSPSLATRKLLTLIFDRETLATHSMTGKASPAFKDLDKPVKGKLDPNAVHDIIFIVSKKCAVSQKEVRAAITTKCADENKMIKLQALKRIGMHDSKRPALRELNKIKLDEIKEENT